MYTSLPPGFQWADCMPDVQMVSDLTFQVVVPLISIRPTLIALQSMVGIPQCTHVYSAAMHDQLPPLTLPGKQAVQWWFINIGYMALACCASARAVTDRSGSVAMLYKESCSL